MPRPGPGTGLPAGSWLAASFEKQGGRGGVRFWYTECFSLWILHVLVLIVDCGQSDLGAKAPVSRPKSVSGESGGESAAGWA